MNLDNPAADALGQGAATSDAEPVDPRRYFERISDRGEVAAADPVCLYLESTTRCNLLCTTCPRTYDEL